MEERQCYLTVSVQDTDYDEADEYVVSTTANGVEVHGRCSPSDLRPDGANYTVDDRGFFECAKYVVLPPSPDGTYTFVTMATPEVDEDAYEGSFVYVEYMVDCEGECHLPSAPPSAPPPSAPPSTPPPRMPSCTYGITPAGGDHRLVPALSPVCPALTPSVLSRTRWLRYGSLDRLHESTRASTLLAPSTFSATGVPTSAVTSATASALVSSLAIQDVLSRRLPAVLGRRHFSQ